MARGASSDEPRHRRRHPTHAERSADTRAAYLARIGDAALEGPARDGLGCANLAHGIAAVRRGRQAHLKGGRAPNIAIVSAYNDMLSAHQPLERYPRLLKQAVQEAGGVAQFAGGVPAMCDGITQGRAGMELSLFSRDVVAMATAVALAHDMFDGALLLGVCDKIVPGLLIGALSFGHLPAILVPAGPMPSGLPNREKSRIRQLYAAGEIGRDELLESEPRATTARARARSTAPRTPTSSWSRRWACTCRARASSTRARRCARR